jgi:hypothetical protein
MCRMCDGKDCSRSAPSWGGPVLILSLFEVMTDRVAVRERGALRN